MLLSREMKTLVWKPLKHTHHSPNHILPSLISLPIFLSFCFAQRIWCMKSNSNRRWIYSVSGLNHKALIVKPRGRHGYCLYIAMVAISTTKKYTKFKCAVRCYNPESFFSPHALEPDTLFLLIPSRNTNYQTNRCVLQMVYLTWLKCL